MFYITAFSNLNYSQTSVKQHHMMKSPFPLFKTEIVCSLWDIQVTVLVFDWSVLNISFAEIALQIFCIPQLFFVKHLNFWNFQMKLSTFCLIKKQTWLLWHIFLSNLKFGNKQLNSKNIVSNFRSNPFTGHNISK